LRYSSGIHQADFGPEFPAGCNARLVTRVLEVVRRQSTGQSRTPSLIALYAVTAGCCNIWMVQLQNIASNYENPQ
jgi:hypothetical protein